MTKGKTDEILPKILPVPSGSNFIFSVLNAYQLQITGN